MSIKDASILIKTNELFFNKFFKKKYNVAFKVRDIKYGT